MIATKRLPKQILPKDVVVARTKLSLIDTEQHDPASSGANHQVLTTPAMITWIVFYLMGVEFEELEEPKCVLVGQK